MFKELSPFRHAFDLSPPLQRETSNFTSLKPETETNPGTWGQKPPTHKTPHHTHTHTHTQCVLVTTLYVLPLYGQHIEWAYVAVENGNGIFAAAMLAIKIKLIGTVVVEKDVAILY